MDIYEKLNRVGEISKETEIIRQTLKLLSQVSIYNVRTAERCLMIAKRLSEKADELYQEFTQIRKEIEKFSQEMGL